MDVTLEQAYAEACRALGEAVVRERLLGAEVQRLTAEQEKPREALPTPDPHPNVMPC